MTIKVFGLQGKEILLALVQVIYVRESLILQGFDKGQEQMIFRGRNV